MLTSLSQSYSNPIPDTCQFGEYACEVFYEKQNLNVWKVIFAFFPRNKLEVRYVYLYVLSMHVSTLMSAGSGANLLEL